MRDLLGLAMLVAVVGCGDNQGDRPDGRGPDVCVGFDCKPVDCTAQQKPPTSISGTVLAPNGTLPLHGVTVYVPGEPPEALARARSRDRPHFAH